MKTKPITKFVNDNKTPLIVVAAVAVAVVVFWIVKKMRSAGSGSLSDYQIEQGTGTPITAATDFRHLVVRLWQATVTYRSASVLVFNWPTGTDEDEVYAVLGCLRTQADYVKLEREWVAYFNEQSWFTRNLNMQAHGTVPAVLKSELTKKELQRCRDILTANGITPDF